MARTRDAVGETRADGIVSSRVPTTCIRQLGAAAGADVSRWAVHV